MNTAIKNGLLAGVMAMVVGCAGGTTLDDGPRAPREQGTQSADGGAPDAKQQQDGGAHATSKDGGPASSAAGADGGDTPPVADAGTADASNDDVDAGGADASNDVDAGSADASNDDVDAGIVDAGIVDAGAEGGAPDAGADAQPPTDELSCEAQIAAHHWNVCIDPSGRLWLDLLGTDLPGGGHATDQQVVAGEWAVELFLDGDLQSGMALWWKLWAPGIAYVDLPPTLNQGICPYEKHPIRVSAPIRNNTWLLLGGYANKQPGIWAALPDQSHGNWITCIGVSIVNGKYIPSAAQASADMLGAHVDCAP